eukprot:GHVL01039462.1.p1 GENE.GHVL01039462.1~~GHVL01039462.1.p1  ORF type:complete len:408 (-),score=74.50 GHVL01039462.1:534-1757(-)
MKLHIKIAHGISGETIEKNIDLVSVTANNAHSLVLNVAIVWKIDVCILVAEGGDSVDKNTPCEMIHDRWVYLFPPSLLHDSDHVAHVECTAPSVAIDKEQFRHLDARTMLKTMEIYQIEKSMQLLLDRLAVQVKACISVKENLAAHQSGLVYGMEDFWKKVTSFEGTAEETLSSVFPALNKLENIYLHPALRTNNRSSLADCVPRQRISEFAQTCRENRDRLGARIKDLRTKTQLLNESCEKETERLNSLSSNSFAIEECKKTLDILIEKEENGEDCMEDIRDVVARAAVNWSSRCFTFISCLRVVSDLQTSMQELTQRGVLYEESLNKQKDDFRALAHVEQLPHAYEATLDEIVRRHEFQQKYLHLALDYKAQLNRMREEEEILRKKCNKYIYLENINIYYKHIDF